MILTVWEGARGGRTQPYPPCQNSGELMMAGGRVEGVIDCSQQVWIGIILNNKYG